MKWLACILFSVGIAGPVFASEVGDTYEQVIAEKGKPVSHLEAGAVQILSYPDATIKLRDNVVISIKAPETAQPPRSIAPAPHPTPVSARAPSPEPEAPGGNLSWVTDYNLALDQARDGRKFVFLFFTGSDWCGWCKKLEHDILTTPEFGRYARGKLVLVELDFPHKKPLPDQLKAQNQMLQGKYNVRGFPTVIILDPTGKQLAKMVGYQKGGPGPFIARIQALGE